MFDPKKLEERMALVADAIDEGFEAFFELGVLLKLNGLMYKYSVLGT